MFIKLFYKPFVCLYREMVATALNAVDCCLLAEIQIESNQITSYKMIVTVLCLRFKRLRTEYRKKKSTSLVGVHTNTKSTAATKKNGNVSIFCSPRLQTS